MRASTASSPSSTRSGPLQLGRGHSNVVAVARGGERGLQQSAHHVRVDVCGAGGRHVRRTVVAGLDWRASAAWAVEERGPRLAMLAQHRPAERVSRDTAQGDMIPSA